MDPRWQPHLEHPVPASGPSLHAQEMLAGGWRTREAECWTQGTGGQLTLAPPDTWRDLRELAACVRTRLALQLR